MERLIILVIWAIGSAFVKGANKKNKEVTNQKRTSQQKSKNTLSTFIESIEKEMQGGKEKQRLGQPTQWSRPVQSAQSARPAKPAQPSMAPERQEPSMLSDLPKPKPVAPPKPIGLEVDVIGGYEEIGGINEAGISAGSKYNNLDLDLKRDLLKGIIYSEILSEPKSLRNMKRRV